MAMTASAAKKMLLNILEITDRKPLPTLIVSRACWLFQGKKHPHALFSCAWGLFKRQWL
jgi:hypothetical protein